jgi:putative membrane protein
MQLAMLLQEVDWQAAHADEPWWYRALGTWGPWALAVLLAVLVLRALVQARRYRAVGVLSQADVEAVHEALRAAEKQTVGEIVPVVVERSDSHPDSRWLAALTTMIAGSAVLAPHLPWSEPALVLLVQLALGAFGFGLALALPGFARLFIGEKRASEMAHEQATQEFHRLDLHRTEAATGVLIFVSLLERRAIVLADSGIDGKVGADDWKGVDEAVLRGVASGSLRDGLVGGIERAGALLAQHFPWRAGDRNELPNRLVVRRQ